MTNLEYVKSQLTDRDVAVMMQPFSAHKSLASKSVMDRCWYAHDKWSESFSSNAGNTVRDGLENPSIFAWEVWHYPDGHTEKRGFSYILSVQQFLNLQYDEKWWADE